MFKTQVPSAACFYSCRRKPGTERLSESPVGLRLLCLLQTFPCCLLTLTDELPLWRPWKRWLTSEAASGSTEWNSLDFSWSLWANRSGIPRASAPQVHSSESTELKGEVPVSLVAQTKMQTSSGLFSKMIHVLFLSICHRCWVMSLIKEISDLAWTLDSAPGSNSELVLVGGTNDRKFACTLKT